MENLELLDKVNILGIEYEIYHNVSNDFKFFKKGEADGICDFSVKKIYIAAMEVDDDTYQDLESYKKSVIRHEIIHAFLYESGLNASSANGWARNEEMIDWIALQFPKMQQIYEQLKVC